MLSIEHHDVNVGVEDLDAKKSKRLCKIIFIQRALLLVT
jgi:hypothetical protein